ncbi:MAG: alpha/beta fold hydrolase [Gammaproteobacteria bacterium]|nr:alpha/beta fold hydrolase [Gammaproteobacteria bacterium]MBU1439682.1 alpha/beta fold hydrolase [Gammaproteobacteria bacterium]
MPRELTDLEKLLAADWSEQGAMLKKPEVASAARAWMGDAAFDEWSRFVGGSRPAHLAAGGPRNILFAPGVMGSTLQSEGLGGVWWLDMVFARDKLEELALGADGNDKNADAQIRPAAIDVLYAPFRQALAVSDSFGGSYQFPYDWRKSFASSADALRQRILDVARETGKPVHLVGHSMGGLMIRTALMLHGKELWPKVGKVVFIGTPHYGSASIAGYLKNHLWGFEALAIMGMFLSRSAFRSMRGVLSLLPAPVGVYPGTRDGGNAHPCANFDLYDAAAWKLDDLTPADTVQLQSALDEARQFHVDLHAWHRSLLQAHKDRMLMIAGVGEEGLFRLEFSERFWGLWDHTEKITSRVPGNVDRDGDGRVPLASAELEGVTLRYVKGKHGGLTSIPSVAADVLAWLNDKPLALPRSAKGALGAHLSAESDKSAAPTLDGSGSGDLFKSLPAYETPTPEFRREIEDRLAHGQLPEVHRARLL